MAVEVMKAKERDQHGHWDKPTVLAQEENAFNCLFVYLH